MNDSPSSKHKRETASYSDAINLDDDRVLFYNIYIKK